MSSLSSSNSELYYFSSRLIPKYQINNVLNEILSQPSCSQLLLNKCGSCSHSLAILHHVICYVRDLHILNRKNICFRVMVNAALQKYIESLGGIDASDVGSNSSYAPKELNVEVMGEKVSFAAYHCNVN